MAISISMVMGGALLVLGVICVLISSLYLSGSTAKESTGSLLVVFFTGLLFLMVGLFFLFVRKISKAQF